MSYQVIVRQIATPADQKPERGEQIYEQLVESLDLSKVIAAVNFKPRVRKPRTPAATAPRS